MDAKFNAQEIIDELRKVLNQNFTSNQGAVNRIIRIVTSSLLQTSWDEKFKRVNERIQRLVRAINDKAQGKPGADPESEAKRVEVELEDIIAFIQMRGGLDPEGAKEQNIMPDFLHAFNICVEIVKKIPWEPSSNDKLFYNLRNRCNATVMRTFAQLINHNAQHFESPEPLNRCFFIIIENIDSTGTFSRMLTPQLRKYYTQLQVEIFSKNLTTKNLRAAIELMLKSDADFKEQIRNLPNDRRKFAALDRRANDDPFFKEEALRCAETTNSIDALVYAMRKIERVGDKTVPVYRCPKLYRRVMERLGDVSALWINNLLAGNHIAHEYCRQFTSLIGFLTPADKDRVYETIAGSELGSALKSLVNRSTRINMKDENDPMVIEIRSIVAYVP